MSDTWYAITSDRREGTPLPPKWARVLVDYLDLLEKPWTWRKVPAPPRRVAMTHAFGSPDGRRRCGARGMLSTEPTCADCRRLSRRGVSAEAVINRE